MRPRLQIDYGTQDKNRYLERCYLCLYHSTLRKVLNLYSQKLYELILYQIFKKVQLALVQGATRPSIVQIRDSAQSTLNIIAFRVSNTLYSGSSFRCQPCREINHKIMANSGRVGPIKHIRRKRMLPTHQGSNTNSTIATN